MLNVFKLFGERNSSNVKGTRKIKVFYFKNFNLLFALFPIVKFQLPLIKKEKKKKIILHKSSYSNDHALLITVKKLMILIEHINITFTTFKSVCVHS